MTRLNRVVLDGGNMIKLQGPILVQQALSSGLGQVENTLDVVLLEHLTEGSLVVRWELNDFDDGPAWQSFQQVRLDLGGGSVVLVAQWLDNGSDLTQIFSGQITTEQQPGPRQRQLEVHR
ncbi:hypothetical protein WICPIJ_000934 [Wickerhamomyces pijperi]|uniref:Uncharacterized protein n=1 Tax=Wickerhamomyces pijperi TaxID=599730 RepID=A0A9P8QET9_WICPI|nr:hypothetical protein WICPIJ_000934 [Wickerhamomyces pijperi]